MRFLADESCDFRVVRALRAAGHDVVAVAELAPSIGDPEVLEIALGDGRVLLTDDKDFGELVYVEARPTAGVIFLRGTVKATAAIAETVVQLVAERGQQIVGRVVVVEPGRVRFGPGPSA